MTVESAPKPTVKPVESSAKFRAGKATTVEPAHAATETAHSTVEPTSSMEAPCAATLSDCRRYKKTTDQQKIR